MKKVKIEKQRSATDNSRIPGIVCMNDGTLIAYFEFRCGEGGDWADISICMRKSTDNGETWSERKTLVDDKGNTIHNPLMIVDSETIHLLWGRNYNECFCQQSVDGGETWSEPVSITDKIAQFKSQIDWQSFAVGPGHGIKTKNGRLIVPIWLSEERKHGKPASACIYSDDHGKTWECGALMRGTDKIKNPNETCVAELSNGDILFNHRFESIGVQMEEFRGQARTFKENEDPRYRCRAVSISNDGGESTGNMEAKFELKDPCCFGSMTTYQKENKYCILFSNCNSRTMRDNLSLRISYDDCRTWSEPKLIELHAGYSDICVNPKTNSVICFYEEQYTPTELNLAVIRIDEDEIRSFI